MESTKKLKCSYSQAKKYGCIVDNIMASAITIPNEVIITIPAVVQ